MDQARIVNSGGLHVLVGLRLENYQAHVIRFLHHLAADSRLLKIAQEIQRCSSNSMEGKDIGYIPQ